MGNPTICNNMMELEGIMLSEISQTEKAKHCMISLICGTKTKTNSEKHIKLEVYQRQRVGNREIG